MILNAEKKREHRELLQRGNKTVKCKKEDMDLTFTEDLKREGVKDPKVHPDVEGEPFFTLVAFKGKTNAVMAFWDSGASTILMKDGIPERVD